MIATLLDYACKTHSFALHIELKRSRFCFWIAAFGQKSNAIKHQSGIFGVFGWLQLYRHTRKNKQIRKSMARATSEPNSIHDGYFYDFVLFLFLRVFFSFSLSAANRLVHSFRLDFFEQPFWPRKLDRTGGGFSVQRRHVFQSIFFIVSHISTNQTCSSLLFSCANGAGFSFERACQIRCNLSGNGMEKHSLTRYIKFTQIDNNK